MLRLLAEPTDGLFERSGVDTRRLFSEVLADLDPIAVESRRDRESNATLRQFLELQQCVTHLPDRLTQERTDRGPTAQVYA